VTKDNKAPITSDAEDQKFWKALLRELLRDDALKLFISKAGLQRRKEPLQLAF